MKVWRSDFYKEFQCIGSRCRDTCCALWEIEVDETSAERYAGDQGPLADEFRKYLVRNKDENYFRLTEEKRCPFLNQQNLCRMILTMGEESLCDICREHPRFYHWFGDYTEVGLGLCCEEAARLLFSNREPAGFEVLSDDDGEQEQAEICEEDYWVELLLRARSMCISLLQARDLPLEMRIEELLNFAEAAQPFLDEEDLEGMECFLEGKNSRPEKNAEQSEYVPEADTLRSLLHFYESLESLDRSWPEQMRSLSERLPELLGQLPAFRKAVIAEKREVDYEHLLVYFVYRYFMEAIYDSSILVPVRFAVTSLQVILLLDLDSWSKGGNFTLEDRIRNVKWYSKEIEYCPDNMERLAEQLEEKGIWL